MESNYGATERKLLGCMLALARWRPYLVGQKFELHTDHQPLVYLQSQPRLSCRNALGVMPTADPMGSQPWGRKSDPMGVKTPWGFSRGVPQKKNY